MVVTDGKCLMLTDSLSYPKSRDAIASKKYFKSIQGNTIKALAVTKHHDGLKLDTWTCARERQFGLIEKSVEHGNRLLVCLLQVLNTTINHFTSFKFWFISEFIWCM